jgi:predicted nucleotidyltransferase
MAQLKRIRTHRSWLLNPPPRKPSREDFGLPAHGGTLSTDDQNRVEQAIAEKLRSYGIGDVDMPKPSRIALEARLDAFYRDALLATAGDVEERLRAVATSSLGIPLEVASTLNAEKRYRAALKHWDSYQTWQSERNPSRAEFERAHGYDTKHAMHLIRLMRMGLEVLETGELRVRRNDADELAAIRDGGLSFDELLSMAETLHGGMDAAATTTKLPPDVDYDRVDALLADVLGMR